MNRTKQTRRLAFMEHQQNELVWSVSKTELVSEHTMELVWSVSKTYNGVVEEKT